MGIYAARVPFGAMSGGGWMDPTIPLAPVRAFAEPPHVDAAVPLLAAAPLDAIGYGFITSAYVIGAAAEAAMIRRLESGPAAFVSSLPVPATVVASGVRRGPDRARQPALVRPGAARARTRVLRGVGYGRVFALDHGHGGRPGRR